jgi:hypothetical protein
MTSYQETNAWLPIAIAALADHDLDVRLVATNVVNQFAPEVLTNAPPR